MFNTVKTALLLGLLTGFFLLVGYSLGGQSGMILALVLATVMNLGSWWFSDRIVIAMTRAQPVGPGNDLYTMVQELAQRAQIPMPRVYVTPDPSPNAFATGRSPSHAAVAVTSGLLQLMPRDEVRAVLAHELGHVANRDTLISAIAATFAGAIGTLAQIAQFGMLFGRSDDEEGGNPLGALVAMLVAPIAATLIQLAVSRSREYGADAYAARLVGSGEPLARALARLERGVEAVPGDATPATAHLYIMSPLAGGGLSGLFRTHPTTQERIRRLRELRVG